MSVPSSGASLTLEEGADTLSRNVGNALRTNAAQACNRNQDLNSTAKEVLNLAGEKKNKKKIKSCLKDDNYKPGDEAKF